MLWIDFVFKIITRTNEIVNRMTLLSKATLGENLNRALTSFAIEITKFTVGPQTPRFQEHDFIAPKTLIPSYRNPLKPCRAVKQGGSGGGFIPRPNGGRLRNRRHHVCTGHYGRADGGQSRQQPRSSHPLVAAEKLKEGSGEGAGGRARVVEGDRVHCIVLLKGSSDKE